MDNVIKRLVGSAQMRIESYKQATSFDEKHAELTLALNAANWGEFFQVLLQISNRPNRSEPATQIALPAELVIRDSTGPVRR